MRQTAIALASSSPLVAVGAASVVAAPQGAAWSAMADQMLEPRFWMALTIVMIFGAFGGIAYELLLRGGAIELPHRIQKNEEKYTNSKAPAECLVDLGVVGRAVVGAAAAIAVLMVISPPPASAVPLSVAAGAAAPAVIRLVRKQIMTLANTLPSSSRRPVRPARDRVAVSEAPVQQTSLPGPVPA